MGYLRDTKRGVLWIGGYRGTTRVFSVVRTALLARLLTPDQFGTYGIAILVLAFLEIFTETGVNTVLIQTKDKFEKYVSTAWVVSIVRGLVISLLLFLSAPLIAEFFKTIDAINILRFTALVPLVRGFINPSVVTFQKHLLFKTEFFFRTLLFIFDASIAVVAALVFRSPIALILGLLAGAILELLLSHVFIHPLPTFEFNGARLRYILSKGKWLTLSGMLDYLFQNGDNLVVGRMLGVQSLGLYQSSYQIATQPITEVGNILSRVTFPIFVKISNNQKRLYSAYLKTLFAILSIVSPLCLMFILFPELLISMILGNQWLEAVPILRVLGVLGIIKSAVLSSYAFLLAHNQQKHVTLIGATGTLTMLASIVLLINTYGLVGAAYAAVLGSLASVIPAYIFVIKLRK